MKTLRCLGAILTGIGAALLCVLLYPFKNSKLDRPDPERPDVLCVHGYLLNESPWGFYRRQLRKAGMGAVNTLSYHSIRWDIPQNSRLIHDRVLEIKRQTGKEVRILIGHSQGGLTSLEYALEYAPKDRKTYIITLGSPLHGTKMTKFGFGPSVRQMEVGSEYLQSLHARLANASHLRILALAGDADLISGVSAHLPELSYATNETIEDLGHMTFLFSRRAIDRIVAFLQREGVL